MTSILFMFTLKETYSYTETAPLKDKRLKYLTPTISLRSIFLEKCLKFKLINYMFRKTKVYKKIKVDFWENKE